MSRTALALLPALLLATLIPMRAQMRPAESAPQEVAPMRGDNAMRFTLDRAGAEVPQYVIVMTDAGAGRYFAGPPNADAEAQQGRAVPIQASAAATRVIFAPTRTVLSGHCETRHKGVADTGAKTLQFLGAERMGTCAFNYADDDKVNAAAAEFQAIALTLRFGEKLRQLHRYDRLGLDAELDRLMAALANGSAAEPVNLRAELQALASDDQVLERVRRKAAMLLAQGQAAGVSAGDRAR